MDVCDVTTYVVDVKKNLGNFPTENRKTLRRGLLHPTAKEGVFMGSLALLQSLKESIVGHAGVQTIYGEPISANGKTIIPVAKVMYGYGGGAGTGGLRETSRGEGGGGGGGVVAMPVGVIEVSDERTRFIATNDRKKIIGAVLSAIAIGMLIGRRR
jgi:uncharacterized spore protein YtfJ